MPDDFIEALRKAGIGAWRREVPHDGSTPRTYGKRVPNRVVEPIPGVHGQGDVTVVCAATPKQGKR